MPARSHRASAAPSAATSSVPAQPHRHRHVVGRARALQLGQEPQPLLRERQRHPLRPRPAAASAAPRRAGLPPAAPPARPGSAPRTAPAPAPRRPSTARTRLTSRIASSECPPRSKKSSSAPTRSSPSTSANAAHSISSPDRRRAPARRAGRGVVRGGQRRPVQLPVRRSAAAPSSTATADGHHVLRQPPRRELPQPPPASPPSPPRRVGRAPRRPPAAGPRARPRGRPPRPAATPGCAASTASTSPGSTRNPRIFTCSSARPANSSCPSGGPPRQVPGPVHPLPAPPNGHATNRSAGQPRPPQVPPRQPRPGHVQLPRHPGRHRLQPPVQHEHPRIGDRRPDRRRRRRPAPATGRSSTHHRRLGRPVRVDQPPRPAAHARRQLRAAAPRPPTTSVAARRQLARRQHRQHRRRHGHAWVTPCPASSPASAATGQPVRPAATTSAAPASQRHAQLQHRRVETATTRTAAPGSPAAHREPLAAAPPARLASPACVTTTPFGTPRRPRRVDHVRQLPRPQPARPAPPAARAPPASRRRQPRVIAASTAAPRRAGSSAGSRAARPTTHRRRAHRPA